MYTKNYYLHSPLKLNAVTSIYSKSENMCMVLALKTARILLSLYFLNLVSNSLAVWSDVEVESECSNALRSSAVYEKLQV